MVEFSLENGLNTLKYMGSYVFQNIKVCKHVKVFGYFLAAFFQMYYLCIRFYYKVVYRYVTSYFSFT